MKAAAIAIMTASWLAGLAATAASAADCDPLPDGVDRDAGYRIGHYSAAVPDCTPGAPTIAFGEVKALAEGGGVILLDVSPIDGSDPDPFDGTWAVPQPHETIPGATWLPETGRGKPEAWLENYLKSNLDRLIAEKPGVPVIVFCRADCWGSWNAAKRLAAWGYDNIRWYPRGIDDWRDNGLALEIGDPVPVEVE
jgi:PQQ-dependent catabolism-associated CXXCW motif protein